MKSVEKSTHIVLGGGASALTLISRLIEYYDVIVIVNGSDDALSTFDQDIYKVPHAWTTVSTSNNLSSPHVFLNKQHHNKVIKYSQAYGLGGNCNINAMLWCSGSMNIYDQYWPSSFSQDIMKRYLQEVEEKIQLTTINASGVFHHYLSSHNRSTVPTNTHVYSYQATISKTQDQGNNHNSSTQYQRYTPVNLLYDLETNHKCNIIHMNGAPYKSAIKRENHITMNNNVNTIQLYESTQIISILIENHHAIGVRVYHTVSKTYSTLYPKNGGEIFLCCGAFQSPSILYHSLQEASKREDICNILEDKDSRDQLNNNNNNNNNNNSNNSSSNSSDGRGSSSSSSSSSNQDTLSTANGTDKKTKDITENNSITTNTINDYDKNKVNINEIVPSSSKQSGMKELPFIQTTTTTSTTTSTDSNSTGGSTSSSSNNSSHATTTATMSSTSSSSSISIYQQLISNLQQLGHIQDHPILPMIYLGNWNKDCCISYNHTANTGYCTLPQQQQQQHNIPPLNAIHGWIYLNEYGEPCDSTQPDVIPRIQLLFLSGPSLLGLVHELLLPRYNISNDKNPIWSFLRVYMTIIRPLLVPLLQWICSLSIIQYCGQYIFAILICLVHPYSHSGSITFPPKSSSSNSINCASSCQDTTTTTKDGSHLQYSNNNVMSSTDDDDNTATTTTIRESITQLVIDLGFFSDSRDYNLIKLGITKSRQIISDMRRDYHLAALEILPGPLFNYCRKDTDIQLYTDIYSYTYYHICGTCPMYVPTPRVPFSQQNETGNDVSTTNQTSHSQEYVSTMNSDYDGSIVNECFQVHGIKSLYIVDASIVPQMGLPTAPIQSMCMALGLIAGDRILLNRERKNDKKDKLLLYK